MKKKVIITGATGLLGTNLAKRLQSYGFEVVSFSRNAEKSRLILPEIHSHIQFNHNNPQDWQSEIDSAYAIINLAGASIAANRLNDTYKRIVRSSRTNTTSAIAKAIINSPTPPKVLISASAIGYYGDCGDNIITEQNPPATDFLAQVCVDWEDSAKIADAKTRLVFPRIGVVLAPDGDAFKKMIMPFRLYFGGKLGTGNQWFSWVHIDDVVGLFIEAIENDKYVSAVNCASPEPVRNIEFTRQISDKLNVPAIFPVPKFILKIALGEMADFVLASQKVLPEYAIQNNYSFKYPKLEIALDNLII